MKASKAQGKEQIAHEIQKNAGDMHTVVFANGAWMRNVHETRGSGGFRRGARSEHIAKRTSNGATRASKSDKNASYRGRLGVKKDDFFYGKC